MGIDICPGVELLKNKNLVHLLLVKIMPFMGLVVLEEHV